MSRALTMPMREPEVAKALLEGLGMEPAKPEQAVLLEPLPADVWEFATKCCWTYDQRAAEFGRQTESPFPAKPYLEFTLRAIAREPLVWIEKSSQILISWVVAVWALHDVLTHRGHDGAWFCLDRALATKHLEERMLRLYQRIPEVYAKPPARIIGGDLEVYHDGVDDLATSSVRAIAQETSISDQASKRSRSWTWTWAHVDETAFTRKQEELIATMQNRCGKIIAPSTPDGSTTYHHRIGYGKSLDPKDTFELVEPDGVERPMQGIKTWRRFGWYCLDIGYDADPEKQRGGAWWNHPATAAARSVTAKWRREMERDATVAAGLPVFTDTERIVEDRAVLRPGLPLYVGLDYSFIANVAGVLQIVPTSTLPEVHLLFEVYCPNCEATPFGQQTRKALEDALPGVRFELFGDDSQNQRTSTGVVAKELGAVFGRFIQSEPTGPGGIKKRVGMWQRLISGGRLFIDPATCPMILRAVRSEWQRDKWGEPLDVHPWKDLVDGPGYVLQNVLQIDEAPRGEAANLTIKPIYRGSAAPVERERGPAGRREVWAQSSPEESDEAEGEIAR